MHKVTDMYFVAALISYGADYKNVDRTDKKNQIFYFEEPLDIRAIYLGKKGEVEVIENPSFEEIKQAYDTVKLLYPPNYSEALRRVKGIIHA